jgi:hypothetical protein
MTLPAIHIFASQRMVPKSQRQSLIREKQRKDVWKDPI